MNPKHLWAAYGPTTLFVLLWGSGGIFSRWGLDHSSAFAFLTVRFGMALLCLILIGVVGRRWLPAPGTRFQVMRTGFLLVGCYSILYFLALEYGVTPGVLATVMGVQPILTLLVVERRFSWKRLSGLLIALAGLTMVVYQSLILSHFSLAGMACALAALLCTSWGAILQKRIQQAPLEVLPLQYAVSLVLCLLFIPFKPFHFDMEPGFIIPVLWLGLMISVIAQLLFYRLIQSGSLVNVTSLMYLVPVVTAIMDYVFLGNALSGMSLIGMVAILSGLAVVFSVKRTIVV